MVDRRAPARTELAAMLTGTAVVDRMAEGRSATAAVAEAALEYMLAADRANARVAAYYCSHHPAVLRSLNRVVSAAVSAGRDIAVCGEMAHDPRYARFFVGIGVRKLSVDPHGLPVVQETIQRYSLAELTEYAERLLRACSVSEVEARL